MNLPKHNLCNEPTLSIHLCEYIYTNFVDDGIRKIPQVIDQCCNTFPGMQIKMLELISTRRLLGLTETCIYKTLVHKRELLPKEKKSSGVQALELPKPSNVTQEGIAITTTPDSGSSP